jgi:hypothetical protein
MNESQITEMTIKNFKAAIDQQSEFKSLEDALDGYRNNAVDCLVDLGICTKENYELVNQVFDAEIEKL